LFPVIFVVEQIDGVGDKELGDTTTVDIQALLEAFFNMFWRCACVLMKLVSGKKQNFWF
jgi:hypothetical protein